MTDTGAELLRAGDCAGFKAGDTDGHCLQNLSDADATVLEIGTRVAGDSGTYSDIDMLAPGGVGYTRKDGTPYPKTPRRGIDVKGPSDTQAAGQRGCQPLALAVLRARYAARFVMLSRKTRPRGEQPAFAVKAAAVTGQ